MDGRGHCWRRQCSISRIRLYPGVLLCSVVTGVWWGVVWCVWVLVEAMCVSPVCI